MSARHKRIALLTEHRQQALNDRVSELGERREEQAQAEANERQLFAKCEQTALERMQAAERGVVSSDWEQLNQWLESLQVAHLQARAETQKALSATHTAQQNVLAARSSLKQIESLRERIRVRDQADERRRDQRAADEHAQSQALRRQERA